jgi:uncharacterized membrane protein (UPF0127 family)
MRVADKPRMAVAKVWNRTRGELMADRAAIANTSELRRTGLLRHDGLGVGEGLWILPCEGVHTFGMRFPIDVVFLGRDKKVLKIRREMPRGRISLCLRAHSVLELAAGAARVDLGDQLEFERVS